jgi:oligosaccharide repeat unit polymerase
MNVPVAVLLLIIAHQLYLLRKTRQFDPFGLHVMVDLVIGFIFVVGFLTDSVAMENGRASLTYGFTVLLGILALYAGMRWRSNRGVVRRKLDTADDLSNLDVRWLWPVFALHVLVATYTAASTARQGSFTFWEFFTGERLGAYLGGDILAGTLTYQLMTATLAPSLMLLAIEVHRRRWKAALAVYASLLFAASAVFVTRLGLIILLLLPGYYAYRSHQRLRKLSIALLLLMIVVFVVSLTALQMWRSSGFDSLQKEPLSAELALSNMEGVVNTARGFDFLMQDYLAGNLKLEYGLNYWYTFVTFVPRALWPEKPLTSFEARGTEQLTGSSIGDGVEVWTFTAWGEGLAQFGVAGVALNLFLYGLLLARIADRLAQHRALLFAHFHFSLLAATFLRGGLQSLIVLVACFAAPAVVCLRLCQPRSELHGFDIPYGERPRARSPSI